MGILVPDWFETDQLKNRAEREVVETLVQGLYDSWLVIPDVGMRDDSKDRQADIVLVHQDFGVLVVEVKGHELQIRDGLWCGREGTPLNPQPIQQALDNSHALQRRIRKHIADADHLHVHFGIAFPNTGEIAGSIPMDIERAMMLLKTDLLEVEQSMERLVELGRQRAYSGALTDAQVEGIVNLLRPDLEFRWDPDARADLTRDRLDEYCDAQISSLVSMMGNRRVAVRGGAGTGKTKLAVRWATKAWAEGDRVLLTCFNRPLADDLLQRIGPIATDDPSETEALDDDDPDAGPLMLVGAFLELAQAFPEVPEIDSHGLYAAEWETKVWGALQHHWPSVEARFDTIVIDEAQDFHPAWIGMLEALLDPDGRRRMLIVADEDQGIYKRGFRLPRADDGWVQAELQSNFRNAAPIARLLTRKLGGAASPAYAPAGSGVSFHEIDGIEMAIDVVDRELERITQIEGRDGRRVLVEVLKRDDRTALHDAGMNLGTWEQRDESIVCETAHRAKGLEFDTVILVVSEPDPDHALLYTGISRAVSELVVVAPREVGEFLGLV